MEFSIGKQALQTGADALNSELSKVDYGAIRKYFEVTNTYIMQKLLLITVPFYYRDDADNFSLYRPDMYIPAMSLITLVLFKGMLLGLSNKFHPEILGITLTRIIIIHFGACMLYKAISYFLDISLDFKDILSFTGYRFFIVLQMKIIKSLFMIGRFFSLYFLVAYFFFLSRSLKGLLLPQNSSKTHMYFLFGVVLTDLVIAFFMS
ncbi:Protein transport protein yif1 [Glugoides intestinalis]